MILLIYFFASCAFFSLSKFIILKNQGGKFMKNSNKSFSSAAKGMALGLAVGSIATMVLSSSKATKKLKKTAENTAENVSSLFKMN